MNHLNIVEPAQDYVGPRKRVLVAIHLEVPTKMHKREIQDRLRNALKTARTSMRIYRGRLEVFMP